MIVFEEVEPVVEPIEVEPIEVEPVATKAEKLLALADFIETLPPEKFEMSYWIKTTWLSSISEISEPKRTTVYFDSDEMRNLCGATACLAGWAVLSAGFKVNSNATVAKTMFNGQNNIQEVAIELLELNRLEAHKLFISKQWPDQFVPKRNLLPPLMDHAVSGSITPQLAAARVRHFVVEGE